MSEWIRRIKVVEAVSKVKFPCTSGAGVPHIRLLCGRRVEAHLRTFREASVRAASLSPAFSKTEWISGYAGDSGSILVCFPRPGILVSLKLVPERPPENSSTLSGTE